MGLATISTRRFVIQFAAGARQFFVVPIGSDEPAYVADSLAAAVQWIRDRRHAEA